MTNHRWTRGLVVLAALTAACSEIIGENFMGYEMHCKPGSGAACAAGAFGFAGALGSSGTAALAGYAGDVDVVCRGRLTCFGGPPSDAAGASGAPDDWEAAGSAGSAGTAHDSPNVGGTAPGVGGKSPGAGGTAAGAAGSAAGLAGSTASAGHAGTGGSTAGSSGTAGAAGFISPACQPDAPVAPECASIGGWKFPTVAISNAEGIMILSTELFGGGFQAFASKRGSSMLAQLWSEDPGEPQWTAWLCFDSLPQPARMAGHAMIGGTLEVFATTLCGALYRRAVTPSGWLPWQELTLPPAGQAVTDVAMSEAVDETDIVYVADGGRVFARPRSGAEPDSLYADWQELSGAAKALLVTGGLRSDQRQQVFMVDSDGAVFTTVQSTKELDAPFDAWSDFGSSQLSAPLVDIDAPLGGPFPLEVFAVDANGDLLQRTQDKKTGVFGPWKAWDGPVPPGKLISISGAGLKLPTDTPLRLMVLTKTRHVYMLRRTANVWDEEWRLFP